MKQQLVISLVVFTVGFGLGYGVTWLLVSGDGDEVTAKPADPGTSDKVATAPPAVDKPVEPPPTPRPEVKPAAATPDASTAKPQPDAKTAAGPDAEAAVPEPDATTAAAPDAAKADAAAKPKSDKWWDQCVGQRCTVNWGGVRGGLSIRKGSIEHGKRVDWKLRFGRAAKLDIIPTDKPLPVEVRAVGLGGDGLPTAAEIEYKRRGKTIVGIIALKLGAKRVTMSPP